MSEVFLFDYLNNKVFIDDSLLSEGAFNTFSFWIRGYDPKIVLRDSVFLKHLDEIKKVGYDISIPYRDQQ